MKFRFFYLFNIIVSLHLHAQTKIGIQYNVDLYKPYSAEASKNVEKVKSYTIEAVWNFEFLKKEREAFSVGLSYKYIYLTVMNKIVSYYSGPYLNYKNIDLITNSNSIGLNLEYNRIVTFRNKKIGHFSVSSNVYFYEHYSSSYNFTGDGAPMILFENPNFFLPSTNLSLGYKQFLLQKEKFNLGAKVSVGTNLYSDWDLFRKYVWLGVGLEMGFGKGKDLVRAKED